MGFGDLLFIGFFLKRHHHAAEFLGAQLHQFFEILAGLQQFFFGFLAGRDVHRDPDRTLLGMLGIDGFGADFTAKGRAIFFAQCHFALKRLAFGKRRHPLGPRRQPILVREVPLAGRTALQLAGLVAQQLLETPVAAGDGALAQKHDADHRVVQNQALLGHH